MKITSILENTTQTEGIEVEHGLSLYVETKRHKILFDMGQTELFSKNASTLGIDLSEVDIAVLSHGHYDHGGGLGRFLEINERAPVYVHKDAFLPHYHGEERYIGLDRELISNGRIVYTDGRAEIGEGLTLFSCNDRERRHGFATPELTELTSSGFIPDDFRHEQYLLIEEEGRRVLISGCSHKGILNIAEWFSPDVLIGGFHFSKLPTDGRLAEAARALAAQGTEFYTCHCTGVEQFEFMKTYMPALHYLPCGGSIRI